MRCLSSNLENRSFSVVRESFIRTSVSAFCVWWPSSPTETRGRHVLSSCSKLIKYSFSLLCIYWNLALAITAECVERGSIHCAQESSIFDDHLCLWTIFQIICCIITQLAADRPHFILVKRDYSEICQWFWEPYMHISTWFTEIPNNIMKPTTSSENAAVKFL
jgi:hypothetical protein